MAVWHITCVDAETIILEEEQALLLNNLWLPSHNFEVTTSAEPEINDVVTVQEEDSSPVFYRISSITPVYDRSDDAKRWLSHYKCGYVRIPAIERDILQTGGE